MYLIFNSPLVAYFNWSYFQCIVFEEVILTAEQGHVSDYNGVPIFMRVIFNVPFIVLEKLKKQPFVIAGTFDRFDSFITVLTYKSPIKNKSYFSCGSFLIIEDVGDIIGS